jgi:type IV pilus assembly protein PilV
MPTKNEQSGFTLVELLIAAVIIAVGILGWAKTQDSSIKGRATSNGITTASELGMAKLEQLALECQRSFAPPSGADPVINTQGVGFTRSWTIEEGSLASGIRLRKIDVVVTWNHYGAKSVQYQRIVVGG